MGIKIGFASDLGVDSAQIMKFYSDYWVRRIALADGRFHAWQFVDPPSNNAKNTCVVALRDSVLLGVMGLNKRQFNTYGQVKLGAELTTWIVDKRFTMLGIGARILSFVKDQFDFLVGMGISVEALPIYLRSDFRFLRFIPRYIFVVDKARILELSKCAPYAKKIVRDGLTKLGPISYEKIKWGEMQMSPKVEGNHFSRAREDLIWRYDNHPYFTYQSFAVRSQSADNDYGYVILRAETAGDIRMLHVIDILGTRDTFESSVRFIEAYAHREGYWAADIFSTYSSLNKHFVNRGWLSAVDDSFINVPYLYHPLEIREPSTTSLIYWSKDMNANIFDISELYITKQDADLDRPTQKFIENAHCSNSPS